jgi:L-ascorbate metabolism protein UlaG (beta-lactamase superfamily)
LTGQIKTINPGEELTVKGVPIQALPAYNLTKFRSPGVPFHPQEAGHVGYLITVKGIRIYHPGDSDFIPEMKGLKPDVALQPVSGTYVMTHEEAVEASAAIQPKVAIPMHVGEVCRQLGVPEQSYYGWRRQYVQLQFEKWYKNWGQVRIWARQTITPSLSN